MIQHPKLQARKSTIDLAARLVAKHAPTMLLARQDALFNWQRSEFQYFFLDGIYGQLTGAKQACDAEIRAPFVTEDAVAWLGKHCLNPYWFWAAIGSAAQMADTLPLTVADMEEGAKALFEDRREALGKANGISGWPTGYSGEVTPWHLLDSFTRGIMWDNDHTPEQGFEHGMLLVQRYTPSRSVRAKLLGAKLPMYGSQLVFNPLFTRLASTPPVVG